MKKLFFTRTQILRAIHAACLFLLLGSASAHAGTTTSDGSGNVMITGPYTEYQYTGSNNGATLATGGTLTISGTIANDALSGFTSVINLAQSATINTSGNLSQTSASAYGINVSSGTGFTLTNSGSGSISATATTNNEAQAISINVSGTVMLTDSSSGNLSSSGYFSDAVSANGGTGSVTIQKTGTGTITATSVNGDQSIGLNASGSTVLIENMAGTISASGSRGGGNIGIEASASGLSTVINGVNGTITASGNGTTGISTFSTSSITNAGLITLSGSSGTGIYSNPGGDAASVTNTGTVTVNTTSDGTGVLIQSQRGMGHQNPADPVIVTNSGTITATGTTSDGIEINASAGLGTVNNSGSVTAVIEGVLLDQAGTVTNSGNGYISGDPNALYSATLSIVVPTASTVHLMGSSSVHGIIQGGQDDTSTSVLDFSLNIAGNLASAKAQLDAAIAAYNTAYAAAAGDGGNVYSNTVVLNGTDYEWENFLTIEDNLQAAFSTFSLLALTSNQQGILGPINTQLINSNSLPAFTSLIAALTPLSTNPAAFGAALDQLSPQKFAQFTSGTAFNNASFDTVGQDSYLAGQRGADGSFLAGNGTIDSSGLTTNDPNYDSGLQMVHSRLLAWNPAPVADGLISDVADPMLTGTDMKESKDMKAMAPAYTDPWNFFVRGNVILAQGFSQTDVPHFDDNTESVELGTDYRICPNFLVGLTAGYAHTDVTLDDNGSSATVDSYSPGLYASYADHGWYSNLSGSYVHNAYTQSRVIGFLGQTATSAPEGNEGVANLDGGYDFHQGALTFGPLAGIQYTHLTVDGFNESGSIADLSVNEEDSDSLRSRLGGHFSYAFSEHGMNITPHLDASWQHEFLDQSRGVTSQFNTFGGGSFSVRTTNPSRDSALVDAGVDADLNRTVTLFADYVAQAGQDDYFGQSVQAGVKIGF